MEIPDTTEESNPKLAPCSICGRTFRPDALVRHKKFCEKNANKKRKIFDSSSQRAHEEAKQITSLPQASKEPPAKGKAPENVKPKPKNNWREKHEELIQTIKRVRGQDVEKNNTSEGTEPKRKVPSDYVQCTACSRYFNQRAAERHIPWCQKKKFQTPKSPATDEAKEKLIARVKYRPPQGKSRLLHRKTKTASSLPVEEIKTHLTRDKESHSSPPTLLDNRNAKNNRFDRINNNVSQAGSKKRNLSRSREKEVSPQSELPLHIIKFKERFPNHINKRNVDLEESFTSEQLRELLSCSRIADRCPRTVPGVRLSGGQLTNRNHNDNWGYRSTDVSRSASSSGGSSNSWNKRIMDNTTLPEVSSSELPGTWMSKLGWNGDLDTSLGSTGSSGSSSNGSLPPLSRESADEIPLTFYCHQCNSKFPLIAAKYCCECGAKRRGIGQISLNQTG